ncbi:hypothetical protein FACS1894141_6820 [Spirochaetia bacterium]|nr:hypothetical protein FACS1894141_6820 [Spirochaetia bacterium]
MKKNEGPAPFIAPVKNARTHPQRSLLNVRGLILIYILLCILTVLFSAVFFTGTLQNGSIPGLLHLAVFLTIPLVLLVFLVISILSLFRDIAARRTGSKFQARLLAYFIVIVLFAAVPVTIITAQSLFEILRFWRSINVDTALEDAQGFALDAYTFRVEHFENLIQTRAPEIDTLMLTGEGGVQGASALAAIDGDLAAVQDFWLRADGTWESAALRGDDAQELAAPPGIQSGFVSRDINRDRDVIRYILYPLRGPQWRNTGLARPAQGDEELRVISYSLGKGFDRAMETIEDEQARFAIISTLGSNIRPLILFYYGVFFFPTLRRYGKRG